MSDVNVLPFELINKFHRFKLSALPMPLPESELITLYTIRDANAYEGVENTLISGLAEKLHVSVPTISRCLSKLEEKGLVQKSSQTNDRRNTYVCLTEQGMEIYEEAFRTLSSFVERALSRIDGKELKQFFATFDKIYDALAQEYNKLEEK
ncbi:MarR family winged helix-turn-helix transcriptional regulator [Hungatella hathewayi]